MTTRRRIVRIIARLNVGGPTRHVVWLTQALNDGEYESTLVTGNVPSGEDDMSWFATEHGVTPLVIPEMSREISARDAITVWKLFKLFRRIRPDIVHTHTAKAGTAGRLAGFLYRLATPGARCRFVHTFHGHVFHSYYGRLKTAVFLAIERTLARINTDRVVVISNQQLHEISEVFRVGRAEQFRVIPLGIDLDSIRGTASDRAALRADLGIAPDELVVGIVGRIAPVKNHALFVRVAASLARKHPSVRFVVYGDGAERTRLQQLATELGAGDRIVFAGTRKAPAIYASCDIVALTSLNEGTPLTLIEAMANGLPVASTAVGGVIDLLGDVLSTETASRIELRDRGITAPSRDEEAVAAAIERLIVDTALREHVARAGHEYVVANYSRQRLIADIRALYRELVH